MDIVSFVIARCYQHLEDSHATAEEINKVAYDVATGLWKAGWFTESELLDAMARAESQTIDKELTDLFNTSS